MCSDAPPQYIKCNEGSGIGYVTHGTDRCIWALRIPTLEPDQVSIARQWLNQVFLEMAEIAGGMKAAPKINKVLALQDDTTIGWVEDKQWDKLITLSEILPYYDV